MDPSGNPLRPATDLEKVWAAFIGRRFNAPSTFDVSTVERPALRSATGSPNLFASKRRPPRGQAWAVLAARRIRISWLMSIKPQKRRNRLTQIPNPGKQR